MEVLLPLLEGATDFLCDLLTNRAAPLREADVLPYIQFDRAFEPVRNFLWVLDIGDEEEALKLADWMIDWIQDEIDPLSHSLLMIGLALGNIKWNSSAVIPFLQSQVHEQDPLIRASAHLALESIRFGQHAMTGADPGQRTKQRLHQYTVQFASEVSRNKRSSTIGSERSNP